jgi:hypothetical protein
MELSPEEPIKKKRGRKKKSEMGDTETAAQPEEKIPKKRGRKPKGGKLIVKPVDSMNENNNITNIILHLKCSMDDMTLHNNTIYGNVNDPLQYNPSAPPTVTSYDDSFVNNFSLYDSIDKPQSTHIDNTHITMVEDNICSVCKDRMKPNHDIETTDTDIITMKDINMKLKEIKLQLYKSDFPDKKSACFWCTYEYDNPSCYIPKYDLDNQTYAYGSFCRPECAAAYLMKENIDDSIKFERYHLLNQIYGKVYNFKKNIKPAPDPYYLLDKFYGNLTIQEYRKLLKSDHTLLIVDKPMTRILPELHEDNEDLMNNYSSSSGNNNIGVYKVKKQSEKKKGPSKSEIIKETFGL